MAKPDRQHRSAGGGGTGGRPPLEPANALTLRAALIQVALLLGVPVTLLIFAKVILRSFFPELGY